MDVDATGEPEISSKCDVMTNHVDATGETEISLESDTMLNGVEVDVPVDPGTSCKSDNMQHEEEVDDAAEDAGMSTKRDKMLNGAEVNISREPEISSTSYIMPDKAKVDATGDPAISSKSDVMLSKAKPNAAGDTVVRDKELAAARVDASEEPEVGSMYSKMTAGEEVDAAGAVGMIGSKSYIMPNEADVNAGLEISNKSDKVPSEAEVDATEDPEINSKRNVILDEAEVDKKVDPAIISKSDVMLNKAKPNATWDNVMRDLELDDAGMGASEEPEVGSKLDEMLTGAAVDVTGDVGMTSSKSCIMRNEADVYATVNPVISNKSDKVPNKAERDATVDTGIASMRDITPNKTKVDVTWDPEISIKSDIIPNKDTLNATGDTVIGDKELEVAEVDATEEPEISSKSNKTPNCTEVDAMGDAGTTSSKSDIMRKEAYVDVDATEEPEMSSKNNKMPNCPEVDALGDTVMSCQSDIMSDNAEVDATGEPAISSTSENMPNGMEFDAPGEAGLSSMSGGFPNGTDMEIDNDDDDECMESNDLRGLGEDFLTMFSRKVATSFFKEYGLLSHQISSYNEFIKYGVQNLFDSFDEITVEPGYDPSKKGEAEWRYASVKFGKVSIDRPTICVGEKFEGDGFLKFLPRHARLQNMTYSARVNVTVTVQVYTQKLTNDNFITGQEQYIQKEILNEQSKEITIGRIPVMVKSELCWMSEAEKGDCEFDHGGYFLIKGTEKTFIAQEQITMKRLWVSNKPNWTVAYRSEWKRKRVFIKLMDPLKDGIRTGERVVTVYFFSLEVPLWILFYALGVSCDKEAIDLIDYGTDDANIINILLASILNAEKECEGFREEVKALNKLNELLKLCKFPPGETIEDCLNKYLFPNLSCNKQKAHFIGYMVKCLLQTYTGKRKCDNRDDFRNKRLELAGELFERELRAHTKHAQRRMVKAMQKDLYGDHNLRSIEHYFDDSIITNGLVRAFSTGAWCHPFKRMERVSGVVATLRRTNPLQMISDMRKTRQQMEYTGKVGDARYPHPSHWGKVCFLSTPDGEHCGLVKNLAITGLVSLSASEPLHDKMLACGMEELDGDSLDEQRGKDKVLLNGEWVGVSEDSLSLVDKLRSMRRIKELPQQVEIKRDEQQKEVRIFSDAGRILRPVLVVKNLKKVKTFRKNYTFQSLLDKGIVELIGSEEEEDFRIAWRFKDLSDEKDTLSCKYTHCEIDMSFLLGLSCSLIPFANHNNAKRVLYQSEKHSHQAIGYSSTNPNIRVDTLTHQLFYPQRPLFCTTSADSLGTPGYSLGKSGILPKAEFFNGQNAIVAVNVHLGYNQEDSLVMNRASLERGIFRSEHTRSYKAEVDNKESQKRPEDCVNFGKVESRFGRSDSLDDDGFPFIGANLQNGDIVVGRCSESGADHSIKLKHTERGRVHKVVLSANEEGKNFAVVSLRQVRSPSLGDKFSSMHGQKGVLGFLESQENFPFTIQGIVPDVVINPHAFPSRQTPGQLLEAVLGKGIACGGHMKYATPFSTLSVDAITDQLHRAGFSRWGNERVYCGLTGQMIQTLIFMGPNFYQRLVHMSEDKVKFRNTGPVNPLTRQPVADRKRFGGIKFGEMERDCFIAFGATHNLHERLFRLSDSLHMHICQKCNNSANVTQRAVPGGRKLRGPYCRFCKSAENVIKANVPYGAKLLCQELSGMGISLAFQTQFC